MFLNKSVNDKNKYVWVFKHSPEKFDDLILLNSLIPKFKKIIETKSLPDLLLYGPPGLGKTSLVNVLKNELDLDMLYINGSIDNSIDIIRGMVSDFTRRSSDRQKCVFIDECLEENEEIRIGSVDNWESIKLKDLPKNTYFPVVSLNINEEKLENDLGIIHIEREAELYEVELDDGRKIQVTNNHPFLIKDENNNIIEKTIKDGLKETDEILSI